MTPERWQRIDALLESALERAADERPRFLAAACGDDLALRQEVEALLAATGKVGRFLETGALAEPALDPEDAPAQQERIGPYRILRQIGHGGMGTVYLATRADDSFRREVAVKVLRPGLGSLSLVRRFRSERQILATLDHPNIARLLDGGATESGRHYLVMEYVEGLPIDEYCDRRRLSVGARCEIFHQVCEAVHYAHQNLVVHRDVKPSNILVTESGEVKLLDFGIAKLLDPAAFPYTVEATATGLRPMTPNYASPEQVRGGVVTTTSDVYSLGVLLYQLLTGRLPHDFRGLAAREVDRILSDGVPVKPSVAVTRADVSTGERATPGASGPSGERAPLTPELLGERRGTRPQQLSRQLAGDLDVIAAKALRKEPAERYGSVEQLAEDLRRHRKGLPVLARQGTFGYAVGKLLRRHKLAVGAGGLMVAMLLLFAGAMARQATETARQRDRAEQVTEFLIGLFEVVDPAGVRGNSITAREVLDRGAERLERELADQPGVRASLEDAIGAVYLNLGLYDEAGPLLETALETREESFGPKHPDVARSLARVATLYRRQGEYGKAEPLYRRALALRESALGPNHPEVADVLQNLAILHRIQGRYDEAESLAHRARAIFERALGSDHPKVAGASRVLAGVHFERGENSEAERYLQSAVAIYRQAYGDQHWSTTTTGHLLGYVLWQRGEKAQAERFWVESLETWKERLGEEHPQVADALVGLGIAARHGGRYDEAEERLRKALAIYEGAMGADHAGFGNCLYELGYVVFLQDRLDEARAILERSLEIREASLGPSHPWVAESLRGLADLDRRQDRLADSQRRFARALEIWDEHPGHQGTAGIPQAYAGLLRATGRAEEAAALEARAAATAGKEAISPSRRRDE